MFCLIGAACYAISNVGEEAAVKRYDATEFLGMIGVFGLIVNTIQLVALELQEVSSLVWYACCLLPAACCLLPAACCLLPAACCLLPVRVDD